MENLRSFLKIYRKFVWRAPDQFPYQNPKEFLSKSVGSGSGQFPFGNRKGLLSESIGKWSGTPMINSKMETLRNSFQTIWKSGLGRPCSIPVGEP